MLVKDLLKTYRDKDFDKYAETQKIPIKELLKKGWCFSCAECKKKLEENNNADISR